MIEPEQLAESVRQYLESHHSVVDYNELPAEVQYALQENPEATFAVFRRVARAPLEWKNIESFIVPIKDTFIELAEKPVAIQGRVIGLSDNDPVPVELAWVCMNCERIITTEGREPRKCPCGEVGKFKIDMAKSIIDDAQIIKVQDSLRDGNTVSLTCQVKGKELLWQARPGIKVTAFGVLKYEASPDNRSHRPKFLKKLQTEAIMKSDSKGIEVTEQDKQYFQEFMKQPIAWQVLVDSFAPHLHGLEEQKELCIYTLGSCGTRRPFNALICGRPARGKTELVKFTVAMHQIGTKITIAKASIPGLTSITDTDPDTQTRITKPGLFAMYDGGIVGITELQAIRGKADLKDGMNDALENKEISSAMAGGEVQMPARCAVLFDTNNFMGSWDYHAELSHNLKFMEPNLHQFLSRLDLISVTPEKADRELHKQIAYKNFETTSTEEALEKFKQDWEHYENTWDWLEGNSIPHFGIETLKKYFAYISTLPLPPLNPELKEAFAENYADVAETEYSVDGRYNRAVKTLAQVRARLLLKDAADEEDLATAIEVVNRSKEIETRTKDGEHDANATLGLKSKKAIAKRENMVQQFNEAIKKAIEKNEQAGKGSIFTVSDLEFEFEMNPTTRNNWDETKIKQYIMRANAEGTIYESIPGQWKRA